MILIIIFLGYLILMCVLQDVQLCVVIVHVMIYQLKISTAIPQSVEGPNDCICLLTGTYVSQHYILHVRFLTCNFVSYINRWRGWNCEAYYTGRFVYDYSGELNTTYIESTNVTYTCQDPGEDPYSTRCSEGTRFKYELYRNFYCDPSSLLA